MHLFPKSTDNIKKVRFFAVKDYEKALFYKNGEFVGEVRGGIYEIEKQAQTKGTEIVWFDTSINEMPWGFPAENGFPTLDNSMVGLFGDMKLRLSDVRVFYQDVVGGGNEWTLQDLKDWIKGLLQTSLRDIFKRYELDQILREDRETVISQVEAKVAEEFSQYGLILESFNILGIKSPASSPNSTESPSKPPITFKIIGQKIAEFAENIQGQMKKAWGKVVDAFAPETPQTDESPSPEPLRANDNFSNLLARANEHVAHAKKFFSEGYFLKSRVAWEKAGKDFWKSLEIAPSATEAGKINQNIISTTINQCQALLEAANQAGKRGDDLHQKGKLTKARQEYQEAIRLNALAFNFIEKNPTVSFPVQPDAIRRKTHKHEIKLQQLSIEDRCVQADVKLDVAQHCQDDPHLLTEGLTSTSDALVLLNEAKLEAQNAPELAEVANIVQNKMVQARNVQQTLQDRMDSLLNIVPTTAVSLDDTDANQTPGTFTTIKPASPPNPKTREKGIKMLREYEFVGGQVRFKVSIHNQTGDVLTDITILFRIPDALKWVAHDPDYSRKGDAVTIPKIGAGEKKTVSLYLEPINCLKSALNASITFFDGKNRPHAIPMEPKEIT
ncbi:MAG TPA: SPFH domain-containing protein, partial [Candidatus Lokiarchaeia archaeon]|nr:SPFH domain-containing protein [Candidatus Lokiarchaeia archaeon]